VDVVRHYAHANKSCCFPASDRTEFSTTSAAAGWANASDLDGSVEEAIGNREENLVLTKLADLRCLAWARRLFLEATAF